MKLKQVPVGGLTLELLMQYALILYDVVNCPFVGSKPDELSRQTKPISKLCFCRIKEGKKTASQSCQATVVVILSKTKLRLCM
jgi:hypothetical protein